MKLKRTVIFFMLILSLGLYLGSVKAYADSDGSITDVMQDWGSNNKANSADVEKYSSGVTSMAGIAISAVIYVFFAMTTFTTVCDLLYISVPFVRPYLYNSNDNTPTQGGGFTPNTQNQNKF